MIKGLKFPQHKKHENIEGFLNWLSTLKTTFYLTGSRYFENANDNSDWDFFCYHDGFLPIIPILVSEGFTALVQNDTMFQSNYTDTGMVIYQLILEDNSVIQIQVYSTEQEVIVKQNAQIFLSLKTNIRKVTDKQERKRMWTLVLNMIDTEYGKKAVARKLKM